MNDDNDKQSVFRSGAVRAWNNLALDLLKASSEETDGYPNKLVCPAGVMELLNLSLPGACGSTHDQLDQLLGWNFTAALDLMLHAVDDGEIWKRKTEIYQETEFSGSYASFLDSLEDLEVTRICGTSPDPYQNKIIFKQTDEIDFLHDRTGDPDAFSTWCCNEDGTWSEQTLNCFTAYVKTGAGFQMACLFGGQSRYQLIMAMPENGQKLREILKDEKRVSALVDLIGDGWTGKEIIHLPYIEESCSLDLSNWMKEKIPEGDFSRMVDTGRASLEFVSQNVDFSADCDGVQAKAVTVFEFMATGMPDHCEDRHGIYFNHPFFYFLVSVKDRLILFEGILNSFGWPEEDEEEED